MYNVCMHICICLRVCVRFQSLTTMTYLVPYKDLFVRGCCLLYDRCKAVAPANNISSLFRD